MNSKRYRPVKKLEAGDTIGVFSPSEPLTEDRRERSQESIQDIQELFKLKWGKNSLASQYYQAGTTDERLEDIEELIDDTHVSALMASWGGKNCNQLVRRLPYDRLARRRLPVIGFSDTAVLLNAISSECNIPTFYGPNILGKLTESKHASLELLRGIDVPPFGYSAGENWETVVEGTSSGRLFGGNLSTFVLGLAGSAAMSKMKDVCFFWESASEPPQIIDQHLTCLENCGFFERVRIMVVGFALYEEVDRKNRPLNELLAEYGARYEIPVVRISTFGHLATENPAIPIGARVRLSTAEKSVALIDQVVE